MIALIVRLLPTAVLCFWFAIAMHIYVPNIGGVGLNLPQNILAWMAMASLIIIIWQVMPKNKRVTVTLFGTLLFLGIVLLLIPQLYTRPEWSTHSLWRLAGLLGGGIFYFTLSQYRMPPRFRRVVFYALLLAVMLQALLTLLQLFFPELAHAWMAYRMGASRPYGIFQQANVLGSFLAVGVALALMLFLFPAYKLTIPGYEYWRTRLLVLLLLLLPAVLVWVQSRTGWLGGGLAAVLMLLLAGRGSPQRSAIAVLLMVIGAGGASLMLWHGGLAEYGMRYTSHTFSNHARYTMLRDAIAMIMEKPLGGWGYGSFEYNFQHFRIHQTLPTTVTEIARHPHNELLLWWIEGGVIALAGLAVLIVGGAILLMRAIRASRETNNKEGLALCLLLLPLVLHTQTEYPFYLSTLHWLLFLLLLAMLERRVTPVMQRRRLPPLCKGFLSRGIRFSALGGVVLMLGALKGGYTLTMAEKSGFRLMDATVAMSFFSGWVHQERREFDLHMRSLQDFNRSGDERLLEHYARWADDYLTRRIDANVYATLLQILQYRQQKAAADRLRHEAALLFPQDIRFAIKEAV
ncbi:O-antigen ligase family protein [Serratia sp. NPDC078593]|uniref:O-antigen ligase family protein n=1 Tax=unclassified Serratia (in: enterobacteria) TaxID=2647522 RepID=UPI0037CD77DB